VIRRFNRYELKYIVPMAKVDAICEDLKGFTVPDDHDGERGYRIVSLYYDSPDHDCFWAKIEGLKFRRKLRLRVYPAGDIERTTAGMVEIKQRMNRTVQKRRLELPLAEAELLCAGTLPRGDLDPLDLQVATEVQYMVRAMHLRPTCITTYMRRAFVGGLYDSGLRITFDMNVGGRAHALEVGLSASNRLFLPPDWSIMEVKANDTVPDWVTSLLGRHGCQIHRVSKYCAVLVNERRMSAMALAMTPLPIGGH
jgi:SPX domain protein involved in polyphosphate accumulation